LKTTFAMCLVAALTLMAGAALAADITYQVYGVAHVSTDLQNNGDKSEIFVSSNTSRVGIKGSMATNNDMFEIIYQYESQVDFNNNGNEKAVWANRNSYAGLKGSWGSLIWGRNDTPFKSLGRSIEYFPERIGDARNATSLGEWDLRNTNMIQYATPVLGEMVKVSAQYVPDQGVENGSLFSGSAVYDKDAIMVGVSFENHGKALEDAYNAAQPDSSESSTGIRAVARYKTDTFSVSGLFQMISNFQGYDTVDAQVFGVGADYLVSPDWDLKAQYYMMDPYTDGDKVGASMLVVGIDYLLTEKARLYLAYATTMNEDNSNYFDPFEGGHGQSFGLADTPEADPDPEDEIPASAYQISPDNGLTPYGVSLGLYVPW
jgi:predicted porin